jgi:phospholipid/cholesterol/gamma-HCH transport system substrate-binding protein
VKGPIPGMRGHAAVFFGALAFSLIMVVAGLRFAGAGPEAAGTYHLQAVVSDAQSLTPGGEVRIAGLRVGEVDQIAQRGPISVVELAIEKRYAPLRRDARVAVRLRTLVGENYVELYPGDADSPALPQNGVIPLDQNIEQPQIDQILSTLDQPTRADAKRLLRGTGAGLAGRGRDLNGVVGGLSETVAALDPVATVLDRQRTATARLIDNLGAIMRQIGARRASITSLARRSRGTFTALADRQRALGEALDDLPPSLAQITRTTGILRRITATSAPVVEQLATDVAELRPAVANLGPTAVSARSAVDELGRAAGPLTAALGRLRAVSGPGAAMLPKLAAALRQLNPAAKYLSPYGKEITAFLASMRSAVNYYDATGHAARVHLVVSTTTPTAYSPETRKIVEQLFASGLLSKYHSTKYSAYQAPGTMNDTSRFDSATFTRVEPEAPPK